LAVCKSDRLLVECFEAVLPAIVYRVALYF